MLLKGTSGTRRLRCARGRDPSLPLKFLSRLASCCPEDDLDLEALVSDMSASLESLYAACSMQSDTTPLRQNGQHTRDQPPPSGARPAPAQASPQQKVQRSQPVHILAAR